MFIILERQHTACRRYRYIAGKTGTAENFAKIDGKKDQLKDHSIFVAFAPKDNPKIAIAILVENGGLEQR
jgi:cell division protein FtsI/penicillin-binding protein 2